MYAKLPAPGTPATADAVSCDATTVTGVPGDTPAEAWITPAAEPGARRGGNRAASTPASDSSSADQPPPPAVSSPVVEALVSSVPATPVSQYDSRSGISRSVRAASSCALP